MRKILALALVAIGVTVGVPGMSGAAPDDVRGPKCLDIVDGTGGYAPTGDVGVLIKLAAPSCKQFTYTLYVTDTEGRALASSSDETVVEPDRIGLTASVAPSNTTVCVYVTASAGQHVFDRAPDEGWVPETNAVCPAGSLDLTQAVPPAFRAFN
jgi:hypothetical protein